MKRSCPNSHCKSPKIQKDGFYRRRCDRRKIQRFRCSSCGKKFSKSTYRLDKNQKKRSKNELIRQLLCANISIRRTAMITKLDRKTVTRRLEFLSKKAQRKHHQFLKRLQKSKVKNLQFDDLVTKENSKMKPLFVSVSSDKDRRFILAAEVSIVPAFGHLAKKAVKKYGYRPNHHLAGLERMMELTVPVVSHNAKIETDEHKNYSKVIRRYLPGREHLTYKSEKACVVGQGEMKKKRFDPLFTINHNLAMLRANINRLIRKTWCTTKRIDHLQHHLWIYLQYYNEDYLGGIPH